MNFLEETIMALAKFDKNSFDVLYVSNGEKKCSWKEFERIGNFDYNNGFGCNEIGLDVVVVGKDWWMERYEYDGSEEWSFKILPTKPKRSELNRGDLLCTRCNED